jgi:hypothetical protein
VVFLGYCLHLTYAQHIGLDFYENLSDIFFLYPNVESHYISSYDRTGGNDDGFKGTYSALYIDDNGEHVIFEDDGPGCIYNIWFTGRSGKKRTPQWGKIRFYFDKEKSPRIEYEAADFFSGLNPPFVFPLVTHEYISSGGFSSSVPLPFKEHLKITTETRAGFYNIYYQLYKNVNIVSWTGQEDYRHLINLFNCSGNDPKKSESLKVSSKVLQLPVRTRDNNETSADLFSLNQKGIIQYIKINPLPEKPSLFKHTAKPLYKPDTYSLNHVYLCIYYDESKEPSVEVPVGPFFGSGLGEADVRGLFIGMSSSGPYYCYFPMPFNKSIRIIVENRSHVAGIDFYCEIGYNTNYSIADKNDIQFAYFGAKYNYAWPVTDESDYMLFDYKGKGHVIGQVMTVEPVKPDVKRWWEGDMRIYIDGENKPRFHGTGHEDEYQGGWSSFWLSNPYSLPLFGEPKTKNLCNIFGQTNGSTTVYRFWPGTIPFKKNIRLSTEHGNQNDTPANYSSVVYYYFKP